MFFLTFFKKTLTCKILAFTSNVLKTATVRYELQGFRVFP